MVVWLLLLLTVGLARGGRGRRRVGGGRVVVEGLLGMVRGVEARQVLLLLLLAQGLLLDGGLLLDDGILPSWGGQLGHGLLGCLVVQRGQEKKQG